MKFLIILPVVVIAAAALTIHEHPALIKSVYDKYQPGGIIVILNVENEALDTMQAYTTYFELSKAMADEGVMMVTSDFESMKNISETYVKKIVQPLYVVVLASSADLDMYIASTREWFDLADYRLFLIFTSDLKPKHCDFCRRPTHNIFNLKFKSRMFVSCCESNDIQEWWADNEGIEMPLNRNEKFGRWISDERRIQWNVKNSLYERRSTLGHRSLRIAIVDGASYFRVENGTYVGLFAEIVKTLSVSMEFEISKVMVEKTFGEYDPNTRRWTGVIGLLNRKEVDLGVSEFALGTDRLNVIDFTIPIIVGKCRVYMKKPGDATVQFNAFFRAFSSNIWIAIGASILIIPPILTLVRHVHTRIPFSTLLLKHYQQIFGVYCQEPLAHFPDETTLRIVYVSMFLTALLVYNMYAASLISILAVYVTYVPYTTLEEFADDGTKKFAVLKGSSNYRMLKRSNETTSKKLMKMMRPVELLPQTITEGFRQVCEEDVAFYVNEALKKTESKVLPCQMVSIDTGNVQSFGMIMQENSQYRGLFNHQLLRLQDLGRLRQLQEKYLDDREPSGTGHPAVGLKGIMPILIIFSIGLFSASFILIIERICSRFNYHRNRYRRKKLIKKYLMTMKPPRRAELPRDSSFFS